MYGGGYRYHVTLQWEEVTDAIVILKMDAPLPCGQLFLFIGNNSGRDDNGTFSIFVSNCSRTSYVECTSNLTTHCYDDVARCDGDSGQETEYQSEGHGTGVLISILPGSSIITLRFSVEKFREYSGQNLGLIFLQDITLYYNATQKEHSK